MLTHAPSDATARAVAAQPCGGAHDGVAVRGVRHAPPHPALVDRQLRPVRLGAHADRAVHRSRLGPGLRLQSYDYPCGSRPAQHEHAPQCERQTQHDEVRAREGDPDRGERDGGDRRHRRGRGSLPGDGVLRLDVLFGHRAAATVGGTAQVATTVAMIAAGSMPCAQACGVRVRRWARTGTAMRLMSSGRT